ncbi:hypothetical protein GCM10025868_04410 [Angustibacter aerolatus]|uniref:TRAM domain-containing protein n=1 Tax=Angustibacter aerolatus TaxID=1162965 RepID=A0ABQ6JEI2_9ACTN|nr:hypothetical protein [Angustibacter aerolatus]GMA85191.1 hypothetical protein GCM10025868_04410 [Angustibacter aerolatus]
MILLADRVLDGRPDQQTFGGIDMTVRRNAFGRQVDSFEEDVALEGVEGDVRAVYIRAPWAEEVGEGVEVLARVEHGPAAGKIVAVRQGRCSPRPSTRRSRATRGSTSLFVEGVRERS